MKICLVSREYPPDTAWGGIGTYTYQLAHGLADRKHEVHVVAQGLNGNGQTQDGPVTVHRVHYQLAFRAIPFLKEWGQRIEHSYRMAQRVRQVIKRHAIDIVEAPNFSAEGFIYSLRKMTPLVTRLHTHFSELIKMFGWRPSLDHRFSCAVEDAAVLRSDQVVCSTEAHSRLVAHQIGMNPERVEKIPLGINLPTASSPKRLDIPHPAVLFVGRLERRKGVHVLLKAIPNVLQEVPDAHFFIIGRDTYNDGRLSSLKGEERYSFRDSLVRQLPGHVFRRIHFLGHVEPHELQAYYRACDVFVAPSLYESFGLIYIEAMSYGKPVIGCTVGGVPEVVKNDVTGILVAPEEPVELAGAMTRLLKDKALREEMGRQARLRVERCFTRDLMAERTLETYGRFVQKAAVS